MLRKLLFSWSWLLVIVAGCSSPDDGGSALTDAAPAVDAATDPLDAPAAAEDDAATDTGGDAAVPDAGAGLVPDAGIIGRPPVDAAPDAPLGFVPDAGFGTAPPVDASMPDTGLGFGT
jgi:hypothetical protein